MMRKIIVLIITAMFILCGCAGEIEVNDSLELNEQTIEQLQLETMSEQEKYKPLNYENQKAVWFTMEDFRKVLNGKSEEEFTADISEVLTKIKDTGFNTIYLHVRPYNDAYYKSEIFPLSQALSNDFDPLEIVLEKSHDMYLSVHAWINPMRCQTDDDMGKLDEKYRIKQWYDSDMRGEFISEVNGRWYLNPAYEEVQQYIADGIAELVQNYNVDGIHIDDYFYPTQDEDFDETAFEKSGSADLSYWRRENINHMVQTIYDTVKEENEDILFGISPQGNVEINQTNLYADVIRWCSSSGYCDYIVPQLYYGFKNESKPFKETLDEWKALVTDNSVSLVIGICTYKIGSEDEWAGTGKDEWIEDKNIPSRQLEYIFDNDCSAAVYSMESLFDEKNSEECNSISEILGDENNEE